VIPINTTENNDDRVLSYVFATSEVRVRSYVS